ncbi:S-layer homology domain-containing protein [Butyricicoccus sp. AF10-3]|nr:S-layer homology domain-containing protein [Butyricicoccus sp. AF10-3]RHS38120.1 S-layer homology domain-containing protein [Butyricicoccus sp. AF10-3]
MAANTVVAANTAYGWTYTPADTANYKALTGSLTPYAVSSGGGGGSSAATPSVSDKAAKELKNAKEGSTVTIDMKGETKLPASVTKEIAGKDVTVELDMGGGMVWSFNGLDVPKGGVSLDLGVKTGTKTIPAKVINALTGEMTTIQLQLNHNGPFGMSLKLSVDLGKKHDGLYANLYFYNPKSSALEFRSAGMISGGKASWVFDHASDYAIVIDKESHESMTFTDVPDTAYYAEAVNWAVAKKITEGVGNKLFGSNDPCTRAQIVTFLWRAAGSPGPKTMSGFSDVPADSYYAKAVAWAVENGITGGTGDGKFSPDATCTRAQAVTFLYRASGAPAVSGNAAFSDVATNAYYAAAVKWAEKNGITGGIGGGLFGSDNNCTRAQIVTFLYRNYQSK